MKDNERLNLDDISKTIAIKVIKIYDYLNKDLKDQNESAIDKALNFGTVAKKFSLSAEDAEIYLKSTCAYSQNQENHEVCDLVAKIYENYETSKSSHQTRKRFAAMENERIDEITKVLKDSIIVDRDKQSTIKPTEVEKQEVEKGIEYSETVKEEEEVRDASSLIDDDTKEKIKNKVITTEKKEQQKEPQIETSEAKKQSRAKIWWIAALVLFFLFVTLRMVNINNNSSEQEATTPPQKSSSAQFEATTAPTEVTEPHDNGVQESVLASQPPIATTNSLGMVGEVINDEAVSEDKNISEATSTVEVKQDSEAQLKEEEAKISAIIEKRIALEKEAEKERERSKALNVSIEDIEQLLDRGEIVINKNTLLYNGESYSTGDSVGSVQIMVIHDKYIKLYDANRGYNKLIILKKRG